MTTKNGLEGYMDIHVDLSDIRGGSGNSILKNARAQERIYEYHFGGYKENREIDVIKIPNEILIK